VGKEQVMVCKTFSFDSSHQLIGHFGKCANLHGHTYKLEVKCLDTPTEIYELPESPSKLEIDMHDRSISDEGFVIDFYHLKKVVHEVIVDKLDHAFIAMGNEPALKTLQQSGAKVVVLGFRTTVENMSRYICWRLMLAGLPVYSVRMWETPTGWAEVLAEDIDINEGPSYRTIGSCDLD
jgi:6-pyruvoyltetrahydropterin/6-carboxytetrahydropterin synthase